MSSLPIGSRPHRSFAAYGAVAEGLQVRRREAVWWLAATVGAGLTGSAGAAFADSVPGGPATRPLRVVALGDSLTAGYMLPADAAFPVVLERALRAGRLAVTVANAGVSGDTAQAGLERLDWSVPDGTDAVILELGANDMLRGLDPATTAATLQTIVTRLKARHIPVFLAGMMAVPSMGPDYAKRFDAIYPDLATRNGLPLAPFFLAGVAEDRSLRLADGMHPTAPGVELMVKTMLPAIAAWLRGLAPGG